MILNKFRLDLNEPLQMFGLILIFGCVLFVIALGCGWLADYVGVVHNQSDQFEEVIVLEDSGLLKVESKGEVAELLLPEGTIIRVKIRRVERIK